MSSLSEKEMMTAELIRDCLNNKRKAQYKLFRNYYGMMMNVCLRYAGNHDEAQDMLNEGFIKIFANLEKYQPTGSFEGWMRRVMANAALDFHRKHTAEKQTVSFDDITETEMMSSHSGNVAIDKLNYEELMNYVQQLPNMSRTVFNLYIFEDYSHAEIAEMLNIKEGTSHWHLNFARTKLKEMISQMN